MMLAPQREAEAASDGNGDAGVRAADWLSLAAAPTFAAMALLGALGGGPADILCSTEQGSPLGGMMPMYVLMSGFHLGPWLKLISRGCTVS
jgi:hypothetical protein